MKTVFVLMAFSAAAVAAEGGHGLKARPAPSDYPAQETGRDMTVAAAVLSPEQVKATFSTDLKDYIVIEVGVYPASGRRVDLAAADFALRAGDRGDILRAAQPRAIAASLHRKNAPDPQQRTGGRDITLYPTATIGVANGRDPMTGRRSSGVYTGGGVGVGIGDSGPAGMPAPPRPASTDRDREVMEQELRDMMLTDGSITGPVAGYLYFPLPAKVKTAALELQYFAAGGKIQLALPPLPKGK